MKTAKPALLFTCLAVLLFAAPAFTYTFQDEIPVDWELHELEADQNGFLRQTGGDPYIIFPEIQEQRCTPSGITFTIRLDPMPEKPSYMELFWRPSYEGFGEDRKVFFMVPPNKGGDTVHFTVPLEDQAGYKQIRLDFPGDLKAAIRVEQYGIVSLGDLSADANRVDSYFSLSASATGNPAIIIPYILKTFRHGMVRMAHDPSFLIFWLIMIGGLLALHRILVRSRKNSTP